jgi:hypothetical protein
MRSSQSSPKRVSAVMFEVAEPAPSCAGKSRTPASSMWVV